MERKRLYVSILLGFLLFYGIGLINVNLWQVSVDISNTKTNTPSDQAYSTNSTDSVSGITYSVHQAYHNSSVVNFDQTKKSFNIPAPNITNYKTSEVYFNLTDIKAQNHSLIIEDSTATGDYDVSASNPSVTSFTATSNCYLVNASFNVRKYLSGIGTCTVMLYNSTWSTSLKRSLPYNDVGAFLTLGTLTVDTSGIKSILNLDQYLDKTKTQNNTWFIGMYDDAGPLKNSGWRWVDDDAAHGDNANETLSYNWDGSKWVLGVDEVNWDGSTIDFVSTVGLSLKKINVKPSDLNLKVNVTSTVVDGPGTHNSGYYRSTVKYGSTMGHIQYDISSEWYSYSFKVNNTQANFTKNDFSVDTKFTVEANDDVYWNTSAIINALDYRLNNNTLNITIPTAWTVHVLSNSTHTITYNTINQGATKVLQVYGTDVGNATWSLTAASTNLLTDLKIGKNGIETDLAYSDETLQFNVTFSKQITGIVNLTVYNPSSIDDEINFTKEVNVVTPNTFVDLGNWIVGNTIWLPGEYRVQVKWHNNTDAAIIDDTIVIALRTDSLYSPNSGLEYFTTDPIFNVSIYFWDTFTTAEDTNITGATIIFDRQLGSGEESEIQNNPDKSYNLTIDPGDYSSGDYYIPIKIEKQYYANYSMVFLLRIVENTIVTEFLPISVLNVIRGTNITYYFNYNQTFPAAPGINLANINTVSLNPNFIWSYDEDTGGNYSIALNTSAVDVGTYLCRFQINKLGYKTQPVEFTVVINQASTSLSEIGSTQEIWRKGGLNVTSTFTLTDISNSELITGMSTTFISVRNGTNPTQLWNVVGWDVYAWEVGSGVYGVNLSINGLNYGWYSAIINVSYTPNYIFSTLAIQFYVRGNITALDIADINSNPGMSLPKVSGRYNIYYHATHIGVVFNVSDTEYADQLLTTGFQYWTYLNKTQILTRTITFDNNIQKNTGSINLPVDLAIGDYNITIIVGKFNYENVTFVFDIRVIAEHVITVNIISPPTTITQGSTITLYFQITYTNGTEYPLTNALVSLSNNVTVTVLTATTNTTGGVQFDFTVPTGSYKQIKLTISYNGIAYGIELGSEGFDINVNPAPGIPPWVLTVIFAAIIGVVSIIGVQKGVIAPRKRRYTELLVNTASVFEDAINLQHLLIIYKATGTCIYFKSFGLEQIDPDLIAGFLSAAQSFVKESMASDGLSEMKSGSSSLLSSDGEMVRITLVLTKPASQFLRSNLSRLIMSFESKYASVLQNWKGQLAIFKDTAELIDEILGTSVILPHNITTDVKAIKSVSSTMAKSILKIAKDLTTGQRQFFFIAQLVAEAKTKLKKEPPEILIGLQDLLKYKVIVPVDLSRYEAQPVSEQELQVLAQRVAALPDLTNEEKQNLVQSLVDMSAAEREVALTSLQQGKKIVSDVSKNLVTTKQFANVKDAKVEIDSLIKQAIKNIKNGEFDEAIRCYETAEVTANQWKLTVDAKKYRDLALDAQIKKFNAKITTAKKEGPKLVKKGDSEKATQLYKEANDAASSLFKLGFTVYEKDVKYFTKLLTDTQCAVTSTEGGKVEVAPVCDDDKDTLLKVEKELLRTASKQEKNKEIRNAIGTYTELMIVADKLFKFGVATATNDIKKYKAKVAELKNLSLKMKADGMQIETEEQLNDQKSQLLNIALEAEKKGDFLKAVVAYQQVLNIYNMLGDAENSSRLEEKIHALVAKIPDLSKIIKSIMDSAENNLKSQNYQNAYAEYQYAKGLCQAINDRDSLKTIELKLITIPKNK